MKRKFFSVLFALVLLCSLSLVMAAPVGAIDAGVTTVAVDPSTINTAGQYTITIDTTEDLSQTNDDDIRITFPEGTEVPAAPYVNNSISINGTDVVTGTPVGVDVLIDDVAREVIIDVPGDVSASADVVVVFKTTALIVNPDIVAADYTLLVSTSEEVDSVLSGNYAITAPEGPVDRYSTGDPLVYEDSYATITLAIAAAGALDTLKAHAGTYTEQVVIDEDVTLESYDGAETTIIDGTGLDSGIDALVWLQVDGITFQGFTVQNCPRDAGGAAVWVRAVAGGTTVIADCLVTENIIAETNDSVLSILLSAASDCIVNDNVVTDSGNNGVTISGSEAGAEGVCVDNLITLNTVTGSTLYGIVLTSVHDDTDFSGNVISHNEISGGGRGIGIFDGDGGDADTTIDVLDNYIHDVIDGYVVDTVEYAALGIRVHESDYVNILRNNVDNCITGIQVESASANVVVNYNDITGNTTIGVEVLEGTHGDLDPDLDAKYNFWGEIGGPSAHADATAQTALGNGDAISDDVLYNPWLSVSKVTVITEGVRYYGSDTLTLQAGWNTLSVPLELYDYADTIAKIEGMGDFLTDINYSGVIYEYDPVSGSFVTPTTLVPCRGYYIKMLADSRFPVLYYNSLGLPALELAPGWNLIGSAFGIDKLTTSTWAVAIDIPGGGGGADAEGSMLVSAALDAIGAQVSVVVSPSCPGQLEEPWAEIWSDSTTNHMYTGEAYWVFMTDTGTLCGFEITPFYFTAP